MCSNVTAVCQYNQNISNNSENTPAYLKHLFTAQIQI